MSAVTDFMILFFEREGSTAIVRTLDLLSGVSIIHKSDNTGWEPFDQNHSKKDKDAFMKVVSKIGERSSEAIEDYEAINLTPKGLTFDAEAQTVGFKIRYNRYNFKGLVDSHKLKTFMLFRRDLLTYCVSKYHGDGSFKPGHMQFKEVKDFEPFSINIADFERLLSGAVAMNNEKIKLYESLKSQGAEVVAIYYEDFLNDKIDFLSKMLSYLGVSRDASEIQNALESQPMRKVHDKPVEEYVLNIEEVRDACEKLELPAFP